MLLIIGLLIIYYLGDFIIFLPSNIHFILYKNDFNFLYKILDISNNEKKKDKTRLSCFWELS